MVTSLDGNICSSSAFARFLSILLAGVLHVHFYPQVIFGSPPNIQSRPLLRLSFSPRSDSTFDKTQNGQRIPDFGSLAEPGT